ncbi:tetratricopeptide (TPR) repeat protein [Streptacidiphilus sp. MAP12-33]|uniref:tetratricopeptide repeat protein n=1 Tax=Streptacidiphilus sp. MAP12-33 TaxID=3156266 RepID=UPI003512B830
MTAPGSGPVGGGVSGATFNGPAAFIAGDHGTQHVHLVYQWRPAYRVEDYPLDASPVSARLLAGQPSRLLRAAHRAVPFTGRGRDLAKLADWRDDPADRLAVRLVHGPGGQGKTRLAARFAELSRAAGWTVWQAVANETGADPLAAGPAPELGAGVLLVVDYAERWPTADLRRLLQDPLVHRTGVPVRVLLLARPAGLWWESLETWIGDTLDTLAESHPLRPLADDSTTRADLFRHARDSFADLLGLPAATAALIRPPQDAELDEDYGQVLTLHIAALAAVDAALHQEKAPDNPARASAHLLGRERAHWRALHQRSSQPLATAPESMGRAVLTATLTRPLARPHGLIALARVGLADSSAAANTLLDDHRFCYPPQPGDPAGGVTVLEPLYPDRLGEDFIGLATPAARGTAHPVAGAVTDDWAHQAAERLLRTPGDADAAAPWTRDVLIVLIETARRWPHVATGQLFPLLRNHPELALLAGGTALTTLAGLDDVDFSVLDAVRKRFPSERNTDLDVGIAAVTARLARHRLATIPDDPVARAQVQDELAVRQARAGLRRPALLAARGAVEDWRAPAAENPDVHAADLAASLVNLGVYLSASGQPEEALTVTEQAADLYRALAETDRAAHESDLGAALNNLGIRLAAAGRQREALAVTEQAVEIRTRLVALDLAAHGSDLAGSLNNLGIRLAALGQHHEALVATVRGTELYRELAAKDPHAHEPDLATSLTGLGVFLAEVGQRGAALEVTEQAEEIWRRLAAANPIAHERDFALTLNNLGIRLAEAGLLREALATGEQAVEIRRRLAEDDPAAHEHDLAVSLTNLGSYLSGLGRPNEALAASEETAEIRSRLAARNPADHDRDLAISLNNLAGVLSTLGRHREARRTAERTVEIWRRLAEENPAAHAPSLALALAMTAHVIAATGELDEALRITGESVEIYRSRIGAAPALLSRLVDVMEMQASILDALGRTGEATQLRRWIAGTAGTAETAT